MGAPLFAHFCPVPRNGLQSLPSVRDVLGPRKECHGPEQYFVKAGNPFSSKKRLYFPICSHNFASNIKLNGVSVALRKRLKPPAAITSPSRFSPACAPRAKPTSCDSEAGVQRRVDAP